MAKYVYGGTITAHTTAKSNDVITEYQAIQTMSAAEEIRTNDAIKFPAGEGNDIRITENAAQRALKVMTFDSSGDVALISAASAELIPEDTIVLVDGSNPMTGALEISGVSPTIRFAETDTTDLNFYIAVASGQFIIVSATDAWASNDVPVIINSNNSTITFSYDIVSPTITAPTIDGQLNIEYANPTILLKDSNSTDLNAYIVNGAGVTTLAIQTDAGVHVETMAVFNAPANTITFSYPVVSPTLTISNTTPQCILYESDAALDEKNWRFYASASVFYFDIFNDGNTVTDTVFTVARTGSTVDNINFHVPILSPVINTGVSGTAIDTTVTTSTTKVPRSAAVKTALDLKADLDSPALVTPTINGVNGYGLVILGTPELLLDTNTPSITAAAIPSTTLDNASAKIAVVSVIATMFSASVSSSVVFYAGNSSSVTANAIYKKAESRISTSETDVNICEFSVPLDGNNDFWYITTQSGSASIDLVVNLVGYYV